MARRRSHQFIDEAFQLDVNGLVKARVLDPKNRQEHPFCAVSNAGGGRVLKGACRNQVENGVTVALDVVAQVGTTGGWGEFGWTRVCVDQAPSHRPSGGWRFLCPRVDVAGKECGKPVRTLYCTSTDCRFRCRECAGLKYRSNVEEDKRLKPFLENPQRLEEELAKTLAVLRAGEFPSTRGRLALRAGARLARDEHYVPFTRQVLAESAEFDRKAEGFIRDFYAGSNGSESDRLQARLLSREEPDWPDGLDDREPLSCAPPRLYGMAQARTTTDQRPCPHRRDRSFSSS